uniref:DNA-binding protein RHL1 n=1 Tax=Salix viminalis TaxID=40686 RepID=A0A6N2ND50_SALVM
MVKSKKTEASNSNRENPDVLERKRLKKLAITNGIVSDNQVKAPYSLNPSKTVAKHHGKDIVRKSQRKNRFLFSFPGLLGPINGGGKIGELKDLSSKNPVLYLDFPQGQMKLFGTILYPKNRYLTLQFSRSGKNVMCEDYFDHMIIFSEAWWIGTKEQNPEELKLDFPKELFEGKGVECDFKGGAGAGSVNKQVVQKSGGTKYVKEESPETELDDDLSDDNNDFKELKETTPIRQSARTSGKKFKFTEVSSGDDSAERSPDALGMEEEEEKNVKTNMSSGIIPDIESESSREGNQLSEQIQAPVTKSKKLSESSFSVTIPKENSYNSHGSLVQPTISTLFKKVQEKKKAEEKGAPRNSRKSSSSKVPDQKLKKTDLKRKIDPVEAPTKRGTVTEGKKAGTGTKTKKKVNEVEDDDIEEFSSASQGTEGSDGDWEA